MDDHMGPGPNPFTARFAERRLKRKPSNTKWLLLLATLFAFSATTILCSYCFRLRKHGTPIALYQSHIAGGAATTEVITTTNARRRRDDGTVKFAPSTPKAKEDKPAEVSIHCKMVCSNSSGGVCVPLDLAIFVYKDGVPTKNMTFDLQNYNPVVSLPWKNNTRQTGVLEVEWCSLEEHFPGVELIPRQGSCAVVGNSGILNNSSCGDFIDSHDFVIRANMGLIKGFEVDVGRKANLNAFNLALMTLYGNAMGSKINDENKMRFLDHIRILKESILWYPKQLFQRGGIYASGRRYQSIIDEIRKTGFSGIRFAFSWTPIHVERSMGIRLTATLGLDMYAVARTFCSNITLFGFYPFYKDLEGRDIRYHYFDEVKYNFSLKRGHDFGKEYTKLRELEKQGNLKLVVRDCKPRAKSQEPSHKL
ncbi:CMP-N-acetylneuraminate-poly-alpha-2,8-sialyltransferase-like [Acanthaster planci]|uniref:CMP-N-acetylneuraminate-poly-alpha-2, 8-sialyltransferase-like n=1 Tax=Acanthaster planci TaxID=133434 RepID=A0A8B7XMH8_ACAPL|nr:CMP-N-acetylneuraminate-poly-alpha-2,8-sialyltransferase-like [Acanthaster planci]